MQIFIKSLSEETISLENVTNDAKIEDIKKQIEENRKFK